MPVIVTLDTGESFMLDRNYNEDQVATMVNDKRGCGALIPFESNATPSRTIYIDPDHVTSIRHNGRAY